MKTEHTKFCEHCGKEFRTVKSAAKFCSSACARVVRLRRAAEARAQARELRLAVDIDSKTRAAALDADITASIDADRASIKRGKHTSYGYYMAQKEMEG